MGVTTASTSTFRTPVKPIDVSMRPYAPSQHQAFISCAHGGARGLDGREHAKRTKYAALRLHSSPVETLGFAATTSGIFLALKPLLLSRRAPAFTLNEPTSGTLGASPTSLAGLCSAYSSPMGSR